MTTRVTRTAARLLAAAALVAAAGATAVQAPPAAAAACSGGTGVTVVVDFHQLGGGVVQKCDASGAGKTAKSLFDDAGFALAYVQRQPGFVCRVDNKPGSDAEACVNTPPQDAYWGLFWADGTSASWKYSTLGVSGLTLQDGQSVAFSWQGSAGTTPPGVKPPATATPSPSPSPKPSSSPRPSASAKPSSSPGSTSAAPTTGAEATGGSATPSQEAERSSKAKAKEKAKAERTGKGQDEQTASATPEAVSATASPVAATAAEPSEPRGGGLPGWALPAVLVALAGVGGATAYVRRRAGGSAP